MAETIQIRRGTEGAITSVPDITPAPGEIIHVYAINNGSKLVGFNKPASGSTEITPQFMVIGDGNNSILELPRYWAWNPDKAISIQDGARDWEDVNGLDTSNSSFTADSPYEALYKILRPYKAPSGSFNPSAHKYRYLGEWADSISFTFNTTLGSEGKITGYRIKKNGQTYLSNENLNNNTIPDFSDNTIYEDGISVTGSSPLIVSNTNITTIASSTSNSISGRTSAGGTFPTRWQTTYELWLNDGSGRGFKKVDTAYIFWTLPIYVKILEKNEITRIEDNPALLNDTNQRFSLDKWSTYGPNYGTGGDVTINPTMIIPSGYGMNCILVPDSVVNIKKVIAANTPDAGAFDLDTNGNPNNTSPINIPALYGSGGTILQRLSDIPYTLIKGVGNTATAESPYEPAITINL